MFSMVKRGGVMAAVCCSFWAVLPGQEITINVPAGGDFQGALNIAAPRDTIVLQAGAVYRSVEGTFALPNMPGAQYITIRSSALASLPGEDQRVRPSDAQHMPKLETVHGAPVLAATGGAHHFKRVGQDAQAIAGWGGPGPFLIQNNYLEGAAENLLFGGASSSVPNVVPSDITIRRNHFYKPRSWQIGQASYAGTPWTVKNLLELKSARRVVIEGKILENNWVHAQTGAAVVFLADTQDGFAVEDVLFANNIVRHSAGAFALLSR